MSGARRSGSRRCRPPLRRRASGWQPKRRVGSGAWIRTTIQGFKVPCPAFRRHRKGEAGRIRTTFSGPVKRDLRLPGDERVLQAGRLVWQAFFEGTEPTGRLVVWGGTVAFQLTMEPEDKEEARFIARLAS